jgi:signal transduction histidine kinase/CheY-like chemotaxis protein
MVSKKEIGQRVKPKVIVGYIIVLGIAVSALAFTYKGFVDLLKTQQSLSDPSRKLIKLNSILTDIYEAESNIRTYTLTQNESYISIYLSFMKDIAVKVDSLLVLVENNPLQTDKIKFIQELLSRKGKVLTELIEIKRIDHSSRFYAMAMEEVEKIDIDSISEKSVVTSVTTKTTHKRDSIIGKEQTETPQGVFNRLFRVFSRKDVPENTITKLSVEVETQIDTLMRAVMSPSDSLLSEVLKILIKIQEQQEASLYNISAKELELLKSDKEIMDQVRTVVSLLEREELLNSYQLSAEVRETVKKSAIVLLSLGGAAFFLTIIFTWLIFRDISKASFYRTRLEEAKIYAEKLLKVKEDFLANMNHEIRTPLSAIVGISDKLKNGDIDSDNKYFIDALSSSSTHLLQVVNDILDLSKIEGGHLKLEKIPFYPSKVVTDVVNSFSIRAEESGIELTITLLNDEISNLLIIGDPLRLSQIMYNLVGNAIKFTPKGNVSVLLNSQAASEGHIRLVFTVSDTGIGIPTEKIDSIFEQFSQVDSSTSRVYGGTGLGLAIVKRIVDLHEGTISVESKVNTGSVFTVTIDYSIAKNGDLRGGLIEQVQNLQLPESLSVLVVDDDPIGRLLVSEMLKKLGVTPDITANPFHAIELAKSKEYSIVLTDIQMPGLSGFDLVNEIKLLHLPNPPLVFALTANSNIKDLERFNNSGFVEALIKPFTEIDLYNTLAPYVGADESIAAMPVQSTHSQSDYDISDLQRFANNDNGALVAILQSFLENSSINLEKLTESVNAQKWDNVAQVAHRMKSSFRQLRVLEVANTLEALEDFNPNQNNIDLPQMLEQISSETLRVQALLRQDINQFTA